MTMPYTPTITLNMADHPVIFFLEPDPDRPGEFQWAWRTVRPLNDHQRARQQLAKWLTEVLYEWVKNPAAPLPDMRTSFETTTLGDCSD